MDKYIRRCLESIQLQSFADFEVIIVNDGSTDCSILICEEFVNRDNRFKLINKKNQRTLSFEFFGPSDWT